MKCKEIQNMIPDYVVNKLLDADRNVVDQHLLLCSECRKDTDAVRALFANVIQDASWKPENTYWGTLVPRIHERVERKRRTLFPPWAVKFLMPAASVAVLVIFTLAYIPINLEKSRQSAETVFQQVETDELIEYVEQQSVVGTAEHATGYGEKALTADDATVLKALLRGEQQAYSYATMDQESINDMVSEQDIDALMPLLEKSYSVSRN